MKILIPSVGGMGVGVFMEWLSSAVISTGLIPAVLNLPGVSQRTGSTLSYMEIQDRDDAPFSPFPEKGRLDLIISQDFLELLRILKEGYGGIGCRILGTTYRYYTTYEKLSLKKDVYTYENYRDVIEANSRDHIVVDIHRAGIPDFNNAHLLGLLSAAGYLPMLERENYEEAIKSVGLDIERNLDDFALGCELPEKNKLAVFPGKKLEADVQDDAIREKIRNLGSVYGKDVMEILAEAVRQLMKYQDIDYAKLYIDRVKDIYFYMRETMGDVKRGGEFIGEFAKVLAVRMMYEDVIRVAERKVSRERFERIRKLYRIERHDVFHIKDFFSPDMDELYGILPYSAGRLMDKIFAGRKPSWKTTINTSHIYGFLLLKALSRLKFLRRRSLRYRKENELVEKYIGHVKACISRDVSSAILAARGGSIVRGYGQVRREMTGKWEEFAKLSNPQLMSLYLDDFFSEKRFETQKRERR